MVYELAMSLNTVTDVVRELLSPEQWRIVRCAALISVHLTEVQRSVICKLCSSWANSVGLL